MKKIELETKRMEVSSINNIYPQMLTDGYKGGRPLWWPKIWTAELAGQNIDGRPNVRPILKRTATLAAKNLDRRVGRPNH
ncbi:hypothetical protein BpHYR1_012390 [Brachionus plicatilis]|uniref:Uncharacterized protein n=1 Tax=Brachionus plicatilis TaxID=10195 RepID=A0A3M7R7F2_BRAPC|nr:hypothetical protein BpHYR1_012390 [Brachionus plicatilis]